MRLFGKTLLAFQTGKVCELTARLIDAVGKRSTSLMKHMFLEIFIIQVKTTEIIQIYRFFLKTAVFRSSNTDFINSEITKITN